MEHAAHGPADGGERHEGRENRERPDGAESRRRPDGAEGRERPDEAEGLEHLDDALIRLRRLWTSSAHRSALERGIGQVDMSSVLVVDAVARGAAAGEV